MRRTLVVVAVVVAASVATAVARPWSDDTRPASETADETFTIDQFRGPYQIVYTVSRPGDRSPEMERIWVRPPFDSRSEVLSGAPPGDETSSIEVGTIDRLRIGGETEPVTVARVPGLAPAATRLAPVIDDAIEAGLLDVGAQRTVLDRRCQVYRSATTLGSGPLIPITDLGYADTCVDARGLILEETLVVDGEEQHTRTAVDVDTDPLVDDDLFDPGEIIAPVDEGGGAIVPASPDSAPEGIFFELDDAVVPHGFRHTGRFSAIPPQPDKFSDPARRDSIIAGVADVYVAGAGASEMFVVYQGGTLGRIEAFAPTAGAGSVSTRSLGDGELLLSARGTEVRFDLPGGRFLHVIGTLAPDDLESISEGLVETTGEGLELLD